MRRRSHLGLPASEHRDRARRSVIAAERAVEAARAAAGDRRCDQMFDALTSAAQKLGAAHADAESGLSAVLVARVAQLSDELEAVGSRVVDRCVLRQPRRS